MACRPSGATAPSAARTDPRDRRTRPSILIELQAARIPCAVRRRRSARSSSTPPPTCARRRSPTTSAASTRSCSPTATPITCWGSTRCAGTTRCRSRRSAATRMQDTVDDLRRMFAYIFGAPRQKGGGVPQLRLFSIAGPFTMGGVEIVPVPLWHGELPVLGFRIGSFAYLTDCNRIPDESWPLLDGRPRRHPRRAARASAPDALQRARSARRRLAAAVPSARTSRTSATTCRTPPPARACPAAWSWPMMGWCWRSMTTMEHGATQRTRQAYREDRDLRTSVTSVLELVDGRHPLPRRRAARPLGAAGAGARQFRRRPPRPSQDPRPRPPRRRRARRHLRRDDLRSAPLARRAARTRRRRW